MIKLAGMAGVVLVMLAVMAPAASAGVGGADPDRFGGSARKATLEGEQLKSGAIAARTDRIPGVGGAEPEGVGGARPLGVGGARPLAGDAATRFGQLPQWMIEALLRGAFGR